MVNLKKRRIADIPPGAENPLTFAVSRRDGSVMDMVADAIRHKQTLLAFQPVVLSGDPSRIGFHEALIRITDETGRVIPARDFMHVVEATEMGREIDVLALQMGLRALHETPQLRLSINMSARSIGYAKWTRTLQRWLDRNPTIAERLILEITEGSAMTVPELVIDFMDRWQVRGICFALDDFGSGQTALRYFKDFFFDILKIDGQFVSGIAQDTDNQALVRSMVSIAQHFDMMTVAEFVETEVDAQVLTKLGVNCLQGYLYGAPTTLPDWKSKPVVRAVG
ncbi:EAL domain-containing protein [Pseudosulfitobacter sp. DSM 107133]|uniref:EAL domain-containing protein n=1 Tax=Pseudosulfitobacter sp. DSM 107133 TaxID=2883100 RepID=UPI001F074512|nr:EAL domain-containing protein [Pseudosulfitobacter sp. DSM 107133]